jgi:maltooligosyltrehalose trehalohydrolase
MIFMGEEWAASTPWQFFASFPDPELAEAVRHGRRAEFGRHGWGEAEVPDPLDAATVARSRLNWDELDQPGHREVLGLYRRLIALRREYPELTDPRLAPSLLSSPSSPSSSSLSPSLSPVFGVDGGESWLVMRRGRVRLACNWGDVRVQVPLGAGVLDRTLSGWGDVVVTGDAAVLPPATFVLVSVLPADQA